MEVERAEGVVWSDVHRLLQDDRTLVEALVRLEDGQAGLLPAHDDRPVDRAWPAVQRQQRGMILDGALGRQVDDRLRHEQGHVGHDAEVRLEGAHQLFGLRRLPRCRLVHLRSEEHTSELQSLMRISYAVFCLKKKSKL